jgi:hypothetical protein
MSAEPTIHVEFIDAESGELIGAADLPASQLPPSFEAATMLQLGGVELSVERAEPISAAEWGRSGRLQLWLRRQPPALIDPGELLYSLPTIVDAIPGVVEGSSKLGLRVLELHEDDWRQVELVAVAQQPALERALAAIRRIHDEQRVGVGFRALHVRDEIPEPLAGVELNIQELLTLFAGAAAYDGLAYQQEAGLIEGGFAFDLLPGLRIYGLQHEGAIAALCIQHDGALVVAQHEAEQLGSLAAHKGLCLVDWCRAVQVPPRHFAAYFTWQAQEAQQ